MASKSDISLRKTVGYTTFALIAFAANSVLCRMALGGEVIDAASFTIIRLASGAIVLLIILGINNRKKQIASKGSMISEQKNGTRSNGVMQGFIMKIFNYSNYRKCFGTIKKVLIKWIIPPH